MKWFVKCIRNYATFKGRARRAEYWYFVLFSFLFTLAAMILDGICFGEDYCIFSPLLSLFFFLPQLAVMVRRLHDTGRSGKIVLWYYITGFVWLVALMISGFSTFVALGAGSASGASTGFLILLGLGGILFLVWGIFFLVWFCTAGTPGDNEYGPDPKAVAE